MKTKKLILSIFFVVIVVLSMTACDHTHEYGEWSVVKPATCTEKGSEERVCECGEKETRDIAALGHSYGEWQEVTPATCTEKGSEKRVCSCGDEETRDIEIDADAHDFGEWDVVKNPSSTEEGEIQRVCSHNASHVESKNILKTPVLSYNTGIIVWDAVDNATSYNVYKDGEFLVSVGNVCNYTALSAGEYSVAALTDNVLYRNNGERSDSLSVVYADNGLAAGNMQIVSDVTTDWRFNMANFSGKSVKLMELDEKISVRLSPDAAVTIAVGGATINRGMTIAVEFDVKVVGAEGGKMNIGLFYSPDWQLVPTDVEIPEAGEDGWAHVRYEYTYGDNVAENAAWGNFDVKYICEEGDGNYAYVADFRISKVEDEVDTRIDTANFGVTKLDGAIDTWYLKFLKYGDYAENEFVFDGEDCALKLTDSDTPDASFIMASDTSLSVAGTYKLTMKVKLGPDAVSSNIGSIGLEIQSDGTPNGKFVEFLRNSDGSWNFSQDEWTTIEAYVNIPERECSWINLRFYFFTNNNVNPSTDNYILIDDITIQLQQVSTITE